MLHPSIPFGDNRSRNRNGSRVSLKIVPKLRHEQKLFGRRKLLNFGKSLNDHYRNMPISPIFGNSRESRAIPDRPAKKTFPPYAFSILFSALKRMPNAGRIAYWS